MSSILETFYILFRTDAKRVQGELKDADKSADKLAKSIDRAGKALPPGQLRDAAHNLDKAADDAARLDRELDSANANAARLGASFGNVIGRLVTLAGAYLGGREIVAYADEFKNLQSQIKLATASQQEFRAADAQTFQIAQATRQGLEGTVSLYASLERSTDGLGYSQKRLLGVTKTINQAITISGTSAAAANAALVQLGQGFASGTLRGDELNSVLEQAPRLAKAIAEGMGVTVGKLRQLGQEGKITADTVFKALEAQGGKINDEFGQMGVTIGASLTVLRNAAVRFVGQLDTAYGISDKFAGGIVKAADALGGLFTWLQANGSLVQGFAIGLAGALTLVAGVLWGSYIPGWIAAGAATLVALAPLIAMGAAVAAIAAAFALAWEDVQAFLKGQPSLLGDLVNKYEFVREAVDFIGQAIKTLWPLAVDAFKTIGRTAVDVFGGIWAIAGPLLGLIGEALGLMFRVGVTAFKGLYIVAEPILRGMGALIEYLGFIFGSVAKTVGNIWGGLFAFLKAELQFVIGIVRTLMGFIEGVRAGADKMIERAGSGLRSPTAAAGVAAGRGQLATANASPLAAQTPASVAATSRSATKNTSVQVGKVEVHTQATDADGMAKAAGGALSSQLRRTTANFDDGVDR